jgi:hypothetical protein
VTNPVDNSPHVLRAPHLNVAATVLARILGMSNRIFLISKLKNDRIDRVNSDRHDGAHRIGSGVDD